MPSWLINLTGSLFGLKTLWDKLDGAKTYIGATAEILTGVGSMAGAAGSELNAFLAQAHDLGSAVNFVSSLAHHWKDDPSAVVFAGGWVLFLHGWTQMGLRHSNDKVAAQIAQANAVPLPNQP